MTYISRDKVEQSQVPLLPQPADVCYGPDTAKWLSDYMSRVLVSGNMVLPREGRLNALFPSIQPLSMGQFLANAWAPKN